MTKKETILVRRLDYKVMKFTYRLSLSYHARSLAANYSILLVNANYKIYSISSEKKKNTPEWNTQGRDRQVSQEGEGLA